MKQISTQPTATTVAKKVKTQRTSTAEPRQSTIDFIKQFARSYRSQPQLNSSLSGFFAN